jgi:hypothetical protein
MLPDASDINTLDFVSEGLPFSRASVDPGIDTLPLDFVSEGLPFIGSPGDSTNVLVQQEETVLPEDETIVSPAIFIDETVLPAEEVAVRAGPIVDADEPIDFTDEVEVILVQEFFDTVRIEISVIAEALDTVSVNVSQLVHAAVTDFTSPTNPFAPTIIINGSYLSSNVETDPGLPAVADTPIFLSLSKSGLFGTTECNLISWNINLDFLGGDWSTVTTAPIGVIFDILDIFGLKGQITETGQGFGEQGMVYLTKGVFGNQVLNQPLQLIARTYPGLAGVVLTHYLQSPPTVQWTTVRDAANAIAAAAGIPLGWFAPDAPLTDMGVESGGSVGSALQSLAARVGAIVIWDGSFGYITIPLDAHYGIWNVPDCSLLLPSGAQYSDIGDLQSYRAVLMPVHPAFNGEATFYMINDPVGGFSKPTLTFYPNPDKIEAIGSISKKLEADHPVVWFPLNPDYDPTKLKIQIRTKNDPSGANVTLSEEEWFPFAGATQTRGDGTKWAGVDSGNFPTGNTDIDENNFQMTLGFVRDVTQEKENFLEAAAARVAVRRRELIQQQEFLRFIARQRSSIASVFFGSIPLCGMLGTVTVEGVDIQGIIQSVSVASPGFITVSGLLNKRFHFYLPRDTIVVGNASFGL